MKKQTLRKWLLLITCCLAIIGLLAACRPKTVTSDQSAASNNEANAEATATPDVQKSLLDHLTNLPIPTPDYASDQIFNPEAKMNPPESLTGSGVFPDNFYTSDILHIGSRGCMSCHADLYTLVKNLSPQMHVASPPSYGKPDDVRYCLTCHDSAGALTGPKFGDILHAYHSNNELFDAAYKGNCWSCHAVDTDGNMALFDTIKYEATFVGFPGANNDDVLTWQKMRGYPSGHMTGFDLVDDFDLEIVNGQ